MSDTMEVEEKEDVFSLDGWGIFKEPWTYSIGAQADWLKLTKEDILEPDLPIVDAHHHLFLCQDPEWYKQRAQHPNVATYMERELAADVNSGHNILATVYVQCYTAFRSSGPRHLKPVGETEFVQGVAAIGEAKVFGNCRFCAGIVVTGDPFLEVETFREALDAHQAAGRNVRGLRFIGGMPERIPYKDPRFRSCVQEVVSRGLVMDFNGPEGFPLNFEAVLGGVADLAEAFPDAKMVVDHCGGAIGPTAFSNEEGAKAKAVWKEQMVRLSKLPNVYMKLGGLVMPMAGHGLEALPTPPGSEQVATAIQPYVDFCIDHFTPARCMFESNFPMDKCSVSYHVLWNAFKRIAARRGMSESDKTALFSGTASKVYNLQL